MAVLLRQAKVIDPGSPFNGRTVDILMDSGIIQDIGISLEAPEGTEILESTGNATVIAPGFVDIFADYREPGYEQKETIATGLAAAARGGFTDVLLLPNTNPVNDSGGGIKYVLQRAAGNKVQLHPLGAVSQGIQGKSLAEMMDMRANGAIAFTDGWKPVQNSGLMVKALEYVKAFNGIVIQMPVDENLSSGGLMNEGVVSTQLGMPGMPSLSESLMVHRDIELTRYAGSRLHITGISAAESVELIRAAKADGVDITCSVTPYHLLLTDESLKTYDSAYKVNPPLRTEIDRQALIAGLADGTIDCIASHHRPQDWDAKAKEFEYAGDGMAIQEIVLPLVLKAVEGKVSLERVVDALSSAPRRIFGLPEYPIEKGAPCCVTIFNTSLKNLFSAKSAASLSRNNPFDGMELQGVIINIYSSTK